MNDLDIALFEAWERVGPRLLEDGEELRRRLERRKGKGFVRPLRAWCVAARANDHRINDTFAEIVPRHAVSLEADAHPGRHVEHRVELTRELLERICRPVEIARPGEPADEVALRLGCHPSDLRPMRRNGALSVHLKPGLRGRRGQAVPLVYTEELLDPQAKGRAGADDIFGCCWRHNAEMMPEGFRQWFTRVPRYMRICGRETFQGWLWVCPCCRKTARILYHPTERIDFPTWVGFAPAKAEPMPKPTPVFACGKCHGVVNFGRAQLGRQWNQLILRCSGGLLYGREVKRPEWLKERRKQEYHARRARPAPRGEQIERLLVETEMLYREIAAQVGIRSLSVGAHAYRIFRRHKVKNRAELRALLRPEERRLAAAG